MNSVVPVLSEMGRSWQKEWDHFSIASAPQIAVIPVTDINLRVTINHFQVRNL